MYDMFICISNYRYIVRQHTNQHTLTQILTFLKLAATPISWTTTTTTTTPSIRLFTSPLCFNKSKLHHPASPEWPRQHMDFDPRSPSAARWYVGRSPQRTRTSGRCVWERCWRSIPMMYLQKVKTQMETYAERRLRFGKSFTHLEN